MPIDKSNLLQHELIGLQVEVIEAKCPNLIGKKGVIMNETQNMILIREEGELKQVPKENVGLLLSLPGGEKVKVSGKKLVSRPENRTKKCR